MKFIATTSTADGRLTQDIVYYGAILFYFGVITIVVYDNKREWTAFDPKVFRPYNMDEYK